MNQIWEANMNFTVEKPTPTDPTNKKEIFIRRKYEDREFIEKNG